MAILPRREDQWERSLPAPLTLIVSVHLSAMGKESLLLQLDSDINVPLLYQSRQTTPLVQTATSPLRSRGTDGIDHTFAVLARQDLQIGPHIFRELLFVMPLNGTFDSPAFHRKPHEGSTGGDTRMDAHLITDAVRHA